MQATVDRQIDTDGQIPVIIPGAPKDKCWVPRAEEYWDTVKKLPDVRGAQTTRPTQPVIPFIASAHEHTEPFPVLTREYSAGLGAETIEFNVPSYGFIRAIWLDVKFPKQKEPGFTEAEDGVFVAIGGLTLLDTNGAPIFGPLTGFNSFLTNLYGGYVYQQDPRLLPTYETVATEGEFRYQIRIPIEISHHDGTGAIGNQNASAPYRVRFNFEAVSTIYAATKAFEAGKKAEVKPYLEAWSLPNAQDALGRPQAQLPPNYGTVQYWSERAVTGLAAGLNNVQVLRVGNLIRNLIFVGRETSSTGSRKDTFLPEFPLINWDARQLNNDSQTYRITRSFEPLETQTNKTAFAIAGKVPSGRPTGVIAYTFNRTNQDRAGDDKPWLWLPTVEATRLELTGNWASANTVVYLVNDVAPAEVNPTQRYAVPSATGFHPETGTQNPATL